MRMPQVKAFKNNFPIIYMPRLPDYSRHFSLFISLAAAEQFFIII